jgi:hypothetical protein
VSKLTSQSKETTKEKNSLGKSAIIIDIIETSTLKTCRLGASKNKIVIKT